MTQLDVRTILPHHRHPLIFSTFDNLVVSLDSVGKIIPKMMRDTNE